MGGFTRWVQVAQERDPTNPPPSVGTVRAPARPGPNAYHLISPPFPHVHPTLPGCTKELRTARSAQSEPG